MEHYELIKEALKARKLSYSPYSKFKVGAAVLTRDGKVILGANIENASYGLCMCAERNALYSTYLKGYKKDDIVAIALIGKTAKAITPCGACRQVMGELMPLDARVIMASTIKDVPLLIKTVGELLPFGFDGSDI